MRLGRPVAIGMPGVMAVGGADDDVEAAADRVDGDRRRDVDRLLEVVRGVATWSAVSSTTVNSGRRTLDVLRTISVPGAGGGQPVDQARVVAGDVLAQRHEPGQRIGRPSGGSATRSPPCSRTVRAEQVVHPRVDDDRRRLVPCACADRSARTGRSVRSSIGPTSKMPRRLVGICVRQVDRVLLGERLDGRPEISASSQRSMDRRPARPVPAVVVTRYDDADRVAAGDARAREPPP